MTTATKTAPKAPPAQFYWNWTDDLQDAVGSAFYDSVADVVKQATLDHRNNGDDDSIVYVWKVELVAVKNLKTVIQITD